MQHIFFDNDGTIVDSEILAVKAMLARLKMHGLNMDVATYSMRYPGLLEHDIFRLIQEEHDIELPNFLPELHQDVVHLFNNHLAVIPGMDTLFRAVKIPKSMVSNGSVRHVERCFERVGMLSDLPATVFSAEHVEKPKPAPDVYHYAMQQTGVAPHEAIVIEDSPTGVQAAKAAGLRVVGFLGATHVGPGHEVRLLESGADYLAENADELGRILQKLGVL